MAFRNTLFLLLLFTPAIPMSADEFRFSYQFATGNAVFGTVEGDLQSDHNTVSNLRNLTATYSATPGVILSFIDPFFQILKLNGVGIMFSGLEADTVGASHQDFGFVLNDPGFLCVNCATVGNLMVSSEFITFPFGANQREAEAFNPAHWSIATIPEPGTLALCEVALAGLATSVLKRSRPSKE